RSTSASICPTASSPRTHLASSRPVCASLLALLFVCLIGTHPSGAEAQDEDEVIVDPTRPGATPTPEDVVDDDEPDDEGDTEPEGEPEATGQDNAKEDAERDVSGDEGSDEELLFDPENPANQRADDSGDDEELLFDPENPAHDADTGDDEVIADPELPTPPTSKEPREPAFMRIGYLTGRYRSLASIDTRFNGEHEDVVE